MIFYTCLCMSLGSALIKTGYNAMSAWNGENFQMGSTATSCRINGFAVWTLIPNSGNAKYETVIQGRDGQLAPSWLHAAFVTTRWGPQIDLTLNTSHWLIIFEAAGHFGHG